MSTSTVRNFNVIENEVLKHFDELYDLLDLPEPHGMQVSQPLLGQ